MPIPFDIANHALLTTKVSGESLDAQTRIAERALQLHGVTFTTDQEEEIKAAIAIQVNFQYERGVEADVYEELEDGMMRSEYRDAVVSALAKRVADGVISEVKGVNRRPATVSLR